VSSYTNPACLGVLASNSDIVTEAIRIIQKVRRHIEAANCICCRKALEKNPATGLDGEQTNMPAAGTKK